MDKRRARAQLQQQQTRINRRAQESHAVDFFNVLTGPGAA